MVDQLPAQIKKSATVMSNVLDQKRRLATNKTSSIIHRETNFPRAQIDPRRRLQHPLMKRILHCTRTLGGIEDSTLQHRQGRAVWQVQSLVHTRTLHARPEKIFPQHFTRIAHSADPLQTDQQKC
jgi:hypothetical protein